MKNFICSFVITSLLTSQAFAQLPNVPPLQLDEPSVGAAISPLKRDQKAPFTGLLYSPEAVAQMTVKLNDAQERTNIELDRLRGTLNADYEKKIADIMSDRKAEISIAGIKLDASLKENNVLVRRIQALENDRSNITLWVMGGIVVGAGISSLVFFVVK